MPFDAKTKRADDAYARLKDEIRSNLMPAGYQATEPEIAEYLGMSRTPVREALVRLAAEGIVEIKPRRGARVLPLTRQDMAEIYEILLALEPEVAANLAARGLDNAELALLERATAKMEKALAADDLDAWAEADASFHGSLLELHGNRRLIEFVETLNDQVHRARTITLRMRAKPHRSTEEHRQVVVCLQKGDSDGARRAFRMHRERATAELLEILETYNLPRL
ncbi:MAG: GntR family transcriptional regulator [Pseudomonadota bacterium]